MANAGPLFCPFCEESFEGEERCPEHDLPLVDFEELSRTRARDPEHDDEELGPLSPKLGRGFVLAGAAAWLIGFTLPFGQTDDVSTSGFRLATEVAINFWTVPMLSLAVTSILFRRRTPAGMRSVRVAVLALVLGVGASLGFTVYRVLAGVERLGQRIGSERGFELGPGPYVIGVGVLLALIGALRLGVSRGRQASYRVD